MAFSDIVQSFTVAPTNNCSELRITDTTDYGADITEVQSKSLIIRDICADKEIAVGGTKQSTCFYITGTIFPGQTYNITIDGCSYSYTVLATDLAPTDEVYASYEVTVGSTASGTDNVQISDIIPGIATHTITFSTGTTSAETAKNLAVAIDTEIIAQGLEQLVEVEFSGTTVALSVSPAWYRIQTGLDINGQPAGYTIDLAGGGFNLSPASPNFAGGVEPSASVNDKNVNTVLNELMKLMQDTSTCATKYDVVLDQCETLCQLKVTAANAGEWFCAEASYSGGTYDAYIYSALDTAVTPSFESKSETVVDIPYPNPDTLLEITLAINSTSFDPEGCVDGTTKELTQNYAAICGLKALHKNLLLAELKDCECDPDCLPESTRTKNYIDAIELYLSQGDTTNACSLLSAVLDLQTQSSCNDC